MELPGVGPVVAARVLTDVGDVARLAGRNRFASWTGTAPLDASSAEQIRHRLSRAGNRRMNHMLRIAAVSQIRLDTESRAYSRRKRAGGKTPLEALRCLKRRISNAVYRQLVADARQAGPGVLEEGHQTGPGGHWGASHQSSAVDLPPPIDTSDQPLPGPAAPTLPAAPDRCRSRAVPSTRSYRAVSGCGRPRSRRRRAPRRRPRSPQRASRPPGTGSSVGLPGPSSSMLGYDCPSIALRIQVVLRGVARGADQLI